MPPSVEWGPCGPIGGKGSGSTFNFVNTDQGDLPHLGMHGSPGRGVGNDGQTGFQPLSYLATSLGHRDGATTHPSSAPLCRTRASPRLLLPAWRWRPAAARTPAQTAEVHDQGQEQNPPRPEVVRVRSAEGPDEDGDEVDERVLECE